MPDHKAAPPHRPAGDPLATWALVVLVALAVLVSAVLIVVVGA